MAAAFYSFFDCLPMLEDPKQCIKVEHDDYEFLGVLPDSPVDSSMYPPVDFPETSVKLEYQDKNDDEFLGVLPVLELPSEFMKPSSIWRLAKCAKFECVEVLSSLLPLGGTLPECPGDVMDESEEQQEEEQHEKEEEQEEKTRRRGRMPRSATKVKIDRITNINVSARALTDLPCDLHDARDKDACTIGAYTKAQRRAKILRYKAKQQRTTPVSYQCYKAFAVRRPRVRGRFVKMI